MLPCQVINVLVNDDSDEGGCTVTKTSELFWKPWASAYQRTMMMRVIMFALLCVSFTGSALSCCGVPWCSNPWRRVLPSVSKWYFICNYVRIIDIHMAINTLWLTSIYTFFSNWMIATCYSRSLHLVCEYNGQTYNPGDSFPSSDGCNSWWVSVSFRVAFLVIH